MQMQVEGEQGILHYVFGFYACTDQAADKASERRFEPIVKRLESVVIPRLRGGKQLCVHRV